MGVTVLRHCKESQTNNPAQHAKNLIKYILDPKKTEKGLWVGGNSGLTADEIYNTFIQTKVDYEKLFGRQAYHFVISFKPGECDEATAFEVAKEFCATYLPQYDHVFAVHNDHAHMHAHIVFNSIDRISGLKYQYHAGDWEKKIQPITDSICEKHGLAKLEYDKENKIGAFYVIHQNQKNYVPTNADLLRMDIDHAIERSSSEEEFLQEMRKNGYSVRKGYSQKHNSPYFAFRIQSENRKKAFRSYNLGEGYDYKDIMIRMQAPDKSLPAKKREYASGSKSDPTQKKKFLHPEVRYKIISFRPKKEQKLQAAMVYRYNRAILYRFLGAEARAQIQVRKDLKRIDKMTEEIRMLLKYNFNNITELRLHYEKIKAELKDVAIQVKEQEELSEILTDHDKIPQTRLYWLQNEKRIIGRLLRKVENEVSSQEIDQRQYLEQMYWIQKLKAEHEILEQNEMELQEEVLYEREWAK